MKSAHYVAIIAVMAMFLGALFAFGTYRHADQPTCIVLDKDCLK